MSGSKILFVEPGKEAQPAEIQGDLKEMQAIVGGQIQALYPWEDPVALICNDEGKAFKTAPEPGAGGL